MIHILRFFKGFGYVSDREGKGFNILVNNYLVINELNIFKINHIIDLNQRLLLKCLTFFLQIFKEINEAVIDSGLRHYCMLSVKASKVPI